MDGKLLILCDEAPGEYDGYKVRDAYYLNDEIVDFDDNSQKLFVSWDSIIPADKTFLDECVRYARTYETMDPDFILSKRGLIDSKNGNVKTSIQEESYISVYEDNINYIKSCAFRGEDYRSLAIDLACEYSFLATDRFLSDLSRVFNKNGVVRILEAHKNSTDAEVVRRRMMLLEAWSNKNKLLRENSTRASLLDALAYDSMDEVLKRSTAELMEIMSLPIFGSDKNRGI